MMEKHAKDLVTVDFYTGHWVQFEASDRLNNELQGWLREKLTLF
jgi:soluble epoxide hydrolase / lipid-phosphate phosphatase